MKKIMEITEEQFNNFKNAQNQKEMIKQILDIPKDTKIQIGDTVVKVLNAKPLNIFKNTFNGRDFYYIIIKSINHELAFAYSIYPEF